MAMNLQGEEVARRMERLRQEMAHRSIDAFVLTDQSNFEYFTGYKSLFWTSKTRPFFAVIFANDSAAIAIASTAEARTVKQSAGMPASLRFEFYTGFIEAGLAKLLEVVTPKLPASPVIAVDYGNDHFGRGSLVLPQMWRSHSQKVEVIDGSATIWAVRMIKSELEIQLKRQAMKVATDAFFTCLETLKIGDTEEQFAVSLKREMLAQGAESIPWLPVRFGRSDMAYSLRPTQRKLAENDYIWVDIGCVREGYMSDVNRIAKAGRVTVEEQEAYGTIRRLTLDSLHSIRAGMTGGDAFRKCAELASATPFGAPAGAASRIGHGSGIDLTEPPSIMDSSDEVIKPGMILHIEPKYETELGVFQLEEVGVVRDAGIEMLTITAPEIFPTIRSCA
ncbi:Xaa-Pro peptidase family protein [Bradyrhizobium sp. CCGUVB1N3]|uniref:M24 family metallopeptidase n=1 Tax=Bradyrhizobium sp. CCGUVB1N3 TaxID=2949629 RepID=UPI0020B411D7|nr:Xaa-Pro peptidase family protein [Bradyrhizobium sp. CCGUVB1N3]MCP3473521.1 Xaa-Pro peptidase family protein [Bradyrhizobium sp. CCGUVB1N3]